MTNKQNHTARMELNKQNKIATGLLSDAFPVISAIVIRMTYYQKGVNPILMLRTVNVLPRDFAYFQMECAIKDCLDGGFNLTSMIADMVKNKKKIGKGTLVCCGKVDSVAVDHASISYEIEIEYNKPSKKA